MASNNWNTTMRRPRMDADRLNAKLDAIDATYKKKLKAKNAKKRLQIQAVKKAISKKVGPKHLAILEDALERLKQGKMMTPKQAGVFGIYKPRPPKPKGKKRRRRRKPAKN